jgi:hypothetical protein
MKSEKIVKKQNKKKIIFIFKITERREYKSWIVIIALMI